MRVWPEGTIRGFSVVGILLGAIGTWLQMDGILRYASRGPGPLPYEAPAFYVEASIDLICALATFVAGVFLWRCGRAGRVVSIVVFATEIAYFMANILIEIVLSMAGGDRGQAISLAMGAVGGIAGMGTVLQNITFFPVIALIVLNLAYRSLDRRKSLGGGNAIADAR